MLKHPHSYWGETYEVTDLAVRKVQDNFSICSCSMCRNERRNPWRNGKERLTMQERRAWDVNDWDGDDEPIEPIISKHWWEQSEDAEIIAWENYQW